MKSPILKLFVVLWFTLTGGLSLQAQEKKSWIPFDPKAAENSPVILNVVAADSDQTIFDVSIPGLWAEEVVYGGRSFLRLSYPPIEFRGVGFPVKEGDPGWWDFPQELKQPRRDPSSFVSGAGSVMKFIFPESAVGQTPRTAQEMEELGIDPEGARPGLPRLRTMVAMSRKNTPESLDTIVEAKESKTIQLELPVLPAGFAGSDGVEGYSAPELIDADFYESFKGEYTGSEPLVGDIGGLSGGFSGAALAMPALTLSSSSALQLMGEFRIYLKHLAGTEDFECPLAWDSWLFTFPCINGQAIRSSLTAKGLKIEASRSARYLILCPKNWRATLDNFATWKQTKGLNVDFVYVGAGGDVAANRGDIDEFLEGYFKKYYCSGVYVLICGDQDLIPSGRSARITGNPDGASADSDHVYEVLGNDRFPSLYVGRLSANSTAELKIQLDKILKYERTPVRGDWPTIATLCANSQMDDGGYGVNAEWPTKYSLAVQQIVTYGSYANPPTFETLHAGASNAAVVRAVNQDVIDSLNEGRGQILYRGHGDENSWVSGWDGSGANTGASFTASGHVDKLENQVQPIVYAINCLNSRINQNDCIAEHWMSLENAGAVAHFGATVTSYTSENHERAKGIFRAIYESGYTRLGPMLGGAESLSFTATGGGNLWDSNTFAYMLLGDPEMEIRRRSIQFTAVGFLSSELLKLGNGVSIRVTDEKGVIKPGSFVNITTTEGLRFNGFANTEGEVIVSAIDPEMVARIDLILDGYRFTAEYLQPPVLEAVGFVAGGGFKVRLKDAPEGTFRVYGSSDMKTWESLGLATQVGSDQEFVDPNAPKSGGAKRFYRAVEEP